MLTTGGGEEEAAQVIVDSGETDLFPPLGPLEPIPEAFTIISQGQAVAAPFETSTEVLEFYEGEVFIVAPVVTDVVAPVPSAADMDLIAYGNAPVISPDASSVVTPEFFEDFGFGDTAEVFLLGELGWDLVLTEEELNTMTYSPWGLDLVLSEEELQSNIYIPWPLDYPSGD